MKNTSRRVPPPDEPPRYDAGTVAAMQALQRGDATTNQQRAALKWVIEAAAATYDHHYMATDRDTAFALGRRFVGQQIVKLLNLDLAILRRNENGRSGNKLG